jgi:hypothetical protein
MPAGAANTFGLVRDRPSPVIDQPAGVVDVRSARAFSIDV